MTGDFEMIKRVATLERELTGYRERCDSLEVHNDRLKHSQDEMEQENKRLLGLIKKASDQLGVASAETPASIAYAQGYLIDALAAAKEQS